MHIKKPTIDKITLGVIYVLLGILTILCLYPIYFVIIASVSSSTAVNSGRFLYWPVDFHVKGYSFAIQDTRIWTGYGNTIFYAVFGTLLGLFFCLPAGYALSEKKLPGRRIILLLMTFTMYFSGGLIPCYIVVRQLGLIDTRFIMVLFGSFSVYNIIIVRAFMLSNVPDELRDAAFIDGCGYGRFFFQIVLPVSSAIIAVISLWLVVGYWNNYFVGLIYLNRNHLKPLQLFMREILLISPEALMQQQTDMESLSQYLQYVNVVKYSMIVISTLPIMLVYPFLQKYFVKGVMVGSLKG